MTAHASTLGWNAGAPHRRGRPRRGLEIAAIILGFIFVWPLALAYLVWKIAGYPYREQGLDALRRAFGSTPSFRAPSFGTGNAAFEEHRRGELARLEEERRRLDEEARAFSDFVEELKRAKDREEFQAFMAKRRAAGPAA